MEVRIKQVQLQPLKDLSLGDMPQLKPFNMPKPPKQNMLRRQIK